MWFQLTDRLTIHPVCMTAYKVTPPCLPFDPHHHQQPNHHHQKDQQDRLEDKVQAASVIKPTAVIELEYEFIALYLVHGWNAKWYIKTVYLK